MQFCLETNPISADKTIRIASWKRSVLTPAASMIHVRHALLVVVVRSAATFDGLMEKMLGVIGIQAVGKK